MANSNYRALSPYQRVILVGNQHAVSNQLATFLHTGSSAIAYVDRLHYDSRGTAADMIVIDIDGLTGEELAQQIHLADRLYFSRIPVVLASNQPVSESDLRRYLACGVLDVISFSSSLASRAVLNSANTC